MSIRLLRRLIAWRPGLYTAAGALWILYHGWPLLLGLLARRFFDALTGGAGLSVPVVVALIGVIGLMRAGIIWSATAATVPLHFGLSSRLRRNLAGRVLARSLPTGVGEAISTLRDDVDHAVEATDLVFDSIGAALFALGGIGILLAVNARVTVLVFLPVALIVAAAQAARSALARARAASRAASARYAGALTEIFASVETVQVAGAEAAIISHLGRLGDARRRWMLRDHLLAQGLEAAFAGTANLGAGLTLLVAAPLMSAGRFSVGDFALFATYLMQVAQFTGFLGFLVNAYRQSNVYVQRMADLVPGAPVERLMACPPAAVAAEPAGPLESLEVRGLTLHYPGGGIANVSFVLPRGSVTVITGPVGAGKTTLLRALLGLLQADAGEVYWNGVRVAEPGRFLVPPRTAYTPQVPSFLTSSLRENLVLGSAASPARIEAAVDDSMLASDVRRLPHGLDTGVGVAGMRLSGGQAQRLAIARMLVRQAELMVVDDLASALDLQTERLVCERLLRRPGTWLMVSNRPPLLNRADQILRLAAGRIVARR